MRVIHLQRKAHLALHLAEIGLGEGERECKNKGGKGTRLGSGVFSFFCQQVASVFKLFKEITGCVQARELNLSEEEVEALPEVWGSRRMGMVLRNSH